MNLNGDCTKELSEPFSCTTPVSVQVDSAGIPIDTVSTTTGLYYKALGSTGTVYSFRVLSGASYVSCFTSGIWYDTIQSTINNYPLRNIGLNCSSSPFDLSVKAVVVGTGRHEQTGNILVCNNSCNPTNATVTLYYDTKYSGNSNPVSSSPGTIVWNLTGLSANDPAITSLNYTVNIPGGTPYLIVGDTVKEYVTVTPTVGDADTSNNTFIKEDTVKLGFDPNFIEVAPAGCFHSDTQFQYTINFENTGNDTAFNIHVMDTLSDNLDISSLKIVTASANMDIELFNDGAHNIVKFDFPQINLLDSSHHGLCDGTVIFTIKNKAGIPNGSTIYNQAGIYFDDNDVVMTNTVENIKGCPIESVAAVKTTHTVEIYPNPTTDELTIKLNDDTYSSFTITNNVGQVLMQQQLSTPLTKVNVKTLPAGLYYITVKGDNGSKVQKFVKM